jgi:hypothetical protein
MIPPLANIVTPPFAPKIPPFARPKKLLMEVHPDLTREIPTETDVPIQEEIEVHPDLVRLTATEAVVPMKLEMEVQPLFAREIAWLIAGRDPIQLDTEVQPLFAREID